MTYRFLGQKLTTWERRLLACLSLVIMVNATRVSTAQAADFTSDDTTTTAAAAAPANANAFQGFTIPADIVKPLPKGASRTLKADITAYTSTPEECDGSPFITADGSVVRDGIIATNVLPFGTQVRIPEYFGGRVFTVHDRMNARYSYRADIWMNDHQAMLGWGVKHNVTIEVVQLGDNKTNWDQWKGRGADYARIGKYGPSPTDNVK